MALKRLIHSHKYTGKHKLKENPCRIYICPLSLYLLCQKGRSVDRRDLSLSLSLYIYIYIYIALKHLYSTSHSIKSYGSTFQWKTDRFLIRAVNKIRLE